MLFCIFQGSAQRGRGIGGGCGGGIGGIRRENEFIEGGQRYIIEPIGNARGFNNNGFGNNNFGNNGFGNNGFGNNGFGNNGYIRGPGGIIEPVVNGRVIAPAIDRRRF